MSVTEKLKYFNLKRELQRKTDESPRKGKSNTDKNYLQMQLARPSTMKKNYIKNLPGGGELSAKVFLARSSEMTNKKYRRGIPKPKQQRHTGSPAVCI